MFEFLTRLGDGALWAYLGVAFASMVPWFELFSIPPAILILELNPVAVGLIALSGNLAVTIVVIVTWERLVVWAERRRGRPVTAGTKRSEKAQRTFEKFGVPGLALQGPILSGMYLAAVIALQMGAARRLVMVWSMISVILWSTILVVGSVAGISFFA